MTAPLAEVMPSHARWIRWAFRRTPVAGGAKGDTGRREEGKVQHAFSGCLMIRLVHRGHAPPSKWALQQMAGSLAFEDHHELFSVLLEAA